MEPDPAPTPCEAIEPLLAASALGEQDPASSAAIAAHLRGCASCRRLHAHYQEVARVLPLGVADAAPSPGLRRAVIDAVDLAAGGRQPGGAAPSRWRHFWPWAVRAGLALSFTALVAWNITLQQSLAFEQAARMEQSAVFTTLLESASLERLPLEADVPGASGALLIDRERQAAALQVRGLPPLPPERVYQLWLVSDGQRISGGTFTTDASGAGMLLVSAPMPLASYQAFGVTVEPVGGSPGPTSPRVVGGRIST